MLATNTDPALIKVLVVDDEPDIEPLIRQKFRRRIRDRELEFVFAGDGMEALEKLAADEAIGIVFTDINMPRMDGLTLLSELSRLNRTLRAVVVSAYGDMENIRTAMNRGAFDFITKPINFDDLEITLERTWQQLLAFKRAEEAQAGLVMLRQELDIARRIQRAMVPRVFPTSDRFELCAEMHPAREVGGDFYDYFFIDERRLGFVIGDVAGKGMPAALFMAMTRTALKAVALTGLAPSDCLCRVNHLLYPESVKAVFVSLFYGVLDTATGRVEYVNAGHNPPYLLRASGGVRPLERTGGLALCLTSEFAYRSKHVVLEPGDGLFLYTDGVTEAMNPGRDQFSNERVEDFLQRATGAPVSTLTQALVQRVHAFSDGAAQSDDITVLALRYTGTHG